ncbi:3-deoxy-manno-octulosonate cytidylyltransferase [Salinisphaera sp.]|uniref:3-deoxy-manno-octulosonate cytidylyltransferase n=1 Tax=Salinisphaera sp. TaxID=1914330 RepID=UPI000C620BD0|nr:3-deoxy-manno-octulosonate cytidylyltransferase [Salinisphaera sp.]MBS62754.1 3-deoxy-manno-octulosonate cytidylyltransferase [Salinisphaera sp.]
MDFVVIIPARLASTRLPNKVLHAIAGEPMLAHVCRAARASAAAEVIVATDSEAVADAARVAGVTACMTRADHSCGTDRIAEVAIQRGWGDETIVVNVQADEPLMPPELIDQVAAALEADTEAAIATACTPIRDAEAFHNPNIVKVVATPAGRAVYFSRAPIPFHRDSGNTEFEAGAFRHLGIYAYRTGALKRFSAAAPGALERIESLEQLRAYELNLPIALVQAKAVPGPGVDTPGDIALVEALMAAGTSSERDDD